MDGGFAKMASSNGNMTLQIKEWRSWKEEEIDILPWTMKIKSLTSDSKLFLDASLVIFIIGILPDWKNRKLNISYSKGAHIYILFISLYKYIFSVNFVLGAGDNMHE